MLKLNDKGQSTMKRLALSAIDPKQEAPAKRHCGLGTSPMLARRLESVVFDRQHVSTNNNNNNNSAGGDDVDEEEEDEESMDVWRHVVLIDSRVTSLCN